MRAAVAPDLVGVDGAGDRETVEQLGALDGVAAGDLDHCARRIAAMHRSSPRAGSGGPYGTPEVVLGVVRDCLEALGEGPAAVRDVRRWLEERESELEGYFTARLDGGWVRECHGDLHLANLACVDGRIVPFDAIEFDPALRWTDIQADAAFLLMDLWSREFPALGWRFYDTWLARTGDYEGVAVLRAEGPAARIGLRPGDILTAVNDEALSAESSEASNMRLLDFMNGVKEGDVLTIEYLRDGKSGSVEVEPQIMADNAFLLSPFTTISLVPDGGLNWLLVHQLGYRRAFQLSVESERIPAERCVELGLANTAVPADELMPAAMEWAKALAERAPLSMAATKKVMRFAANKDWGAAYDMEAKFQG